MRTAFGWRALRLGAIGMMLTHAATLCAAGPDPYLRPKTIPAPADNTFTPTRIALGKALFFDPRMSQSRQVSCASCHQPAAGWADGLPTAIGSNQVKLPRATPTIINIAYNPVFNWDGKFNALEDHAFGLLQNERVMSPPVPVMLERLQSIPGYVYLFHKAYPGEGITQKTVAKALANFQRTVVSTESPFDRWRKGEQNAVSRSAKRGFTLFTGKAKCSTCHEGYNFTDNGFHNIGLRDNGSKPDVGRYAIRRVAISKGAFKTPTLRDVALTAPYMHNGAYETLAQVVEHYDRGGDVKDNLSPNITPLHLSAQEKRDLVAFMQSLTGAPLKISPPRLPQ
jgi:cytochrome c peroxidase